MNHAYDNFTDPISIIFINVIKGLKNLNEYISDSWSRGAIIGRYAGRLKNPIKVNSKLYEIENEKVSCCIADLKVGEKKTGP